MYSSVEIQFVKVYIDSYKLVSHTLTNHMQKDGHLYTSFVSWYVEVTRVPPLITDVSAGDDV